MKLLKTREQRQNKPRRAEAGSLKQRALKDHKKPDRGHPETSENETDSSEIMENTEQAARMRQGNPR